MSVCDQKAPNKQRADAALEARPHGPVEADTAAEAPLTFRKHDCLIARVFQDRLDYYRKSRKPNNSVSARIMSSVLSISRGVKLGRLGEDTASPPLHRHTQDKSFVLNISSSKSRIGKRINWDPWLIQNVKNSPSYVSLQVARGMAL